MRRHERGATRGQFSHVGSQLLCPQCAIQPEGDRPGVRERIPERRRRLPRERPPRSVRDRAGNHHRQSLSAFLEQFFNRKNSGLGVERVEYRLDEQQIGSAVRQPARRIEIIFDERCEFDAAETGVVYVGRNRQRARSRPQHTRAKARFLRRARRVFVAQIARQPGAGHVQFVSDLREAVIGLRHLCGVERTRLDHVRSGFQICAMDATDDVGSCEHEHIVIALDFLRVGGKTRAAIIRSGQRVLLDHRSHRAVQHQNTAGEMVAEFFTAVGLHHVLVLRRSATHKSKRRGKPHQGLRAPLHHSAAEPGLSFAGRNAPRQAADFRARGRGLSRAHAPRIISTTAVRLVVPECDILRVSRRVAYFPHSNFAVDRVWLRSYRTVIAARICTYRTYFAA